MVVNLNIKGMLQTRQQCLALALFKAKVKVTNILPNTVYLGIITLTVPVHWYTSVIGTAIVRRKIAY